MKHVTLGELVEIKGGGTPDKSVADFWGGDIPWASVKDFKSGLLDRTVDKISQLGVASSATQIIPAGSIIVPTRMAVGKVAINTIDLAINQDLKALLPRRGVDTRFLYHALLASGRKLEEQATGATVKGIKLEVLRNLEIPLPPLEEQKRIAAILDQADALRRLRRRAHDRLNTLGQAIFHEMFGAEAVCKNNWTYGTLADLAPANDRINYGVVQPGDHDPMGVPIIRVGDLLTPVVNFANIKRISKSIDGAYSRSRLQGGEILIGCVGSIGTTIIAPTEFKGANIARAVARVPLSADLCHPEFVCEQLRSPRVQRYFQNEIRLVAQPTLNIKQIREVEVILPPIDLQRQFAYRMGKNRKANALAGEAVRIEEKLFNSLQHRAFRGEL